MDTLYKKDIIITNKWLIDYEELGAIITYLLFLLDNYTIHLILTYPVVLYDERNMTCTNIKSC